MENNENKKTTNQYILELSSSDGKKVLVPTLPFFSLTKMTDEAYASLTNTCLTNEAFASQIDPSWAHRRGAYPISKSASEMLIKENNQLLTFFGFPIDFLSLIGSVIKERYKTNLLGLVQKYGSRNISIRNSFFLGHNDFDVYGLDLDANNNILFNFIQNTKYGLDKDLFNQANNELPHREIHPSNGIRRFYSPTVINNEDVPRRNNFGVTTPIFAENLKKILVSGDKQLRSSAFDFIDRHIEYDKFFIRETKGERYFVIMEDDEFCDLAKKLIDCILNSQEGKSLIERGAKISENSIKSLLNELDIGYCRYTHCFGDNQEGRKGLIDEIKRMFAKNFEIKQKGSEIWGWETEIMDQISNKNGDEYAITNYWQSVVIAVFFTFEHLESKKREIIYSNFLQCYKDIKSNDLNLEAYLDNYLDSNFDYVTPALVKKLMDGTDILLQEKDWVGLNNFIIKNYRILEASEHVTQEFYFAKTSTIDKFDDLFLIHNDKLVVQIPKLIELFIKHGFVEEDSYAINSLVDIKQSISEDVCKISKFEFYDDGLPYINGITSKSFGKHFIKKKRHYFRYKSDEWDYNKKEYYLNTKNLSTGRNELVNFKVNNYITHIFLLLAQKSDHRLQYFISLLIPGLWKELDLAAKLFEKENFLKADSLNITYILKKIFDSYVEQKNEYNKTVKELNKQKKNYNVRCFRLYPKELNTGTKEKDKYKTYARKGYIAEIIGRNLNISIFIEKLNGHIYDSKGKKLLKVVLDGNELKLEETDSAVSAYNLPILNNKLKTVRLESELTTYQKELSVGLKKVLSAGNNELIMRIDNWLLEIQKDKNLYSMFCELISKISFNKDDHKNLFRFFSDQTEEFILKRLDNCFICLYICMLSDLKIIKKIILQANKLPSDAFNIVSKKLIGLNFRFAELLFCKNIPELNDENQNTSKFYLNKKNNAPLSDYSNAYASDLFGDRTNLELNEKPATNIKINKTPGEAFIYNLIKNINNKQVATYFRFLGTLNDKGKSKLEFLKPIVNYLKKKHISAFKSLMSMLRDNNDFLYDRLNKKNVDNGCKIKNNTNNMPGLYKYSKIPNMTGSISTQSEFLNL